jgi:hypothetical protein
MSFHVFLSRKWIDADRAGLPTRTRLTEAASEWKNADKDPAYLYIGASGCSPNGSCLVTTGVDGTVRLRKLLFDRPARLIGLQGGATVLAFDDTGRPVTTKGTWGTVVQWDLSGRNRTRAEILFEDRNTSVVSVSFNSKGSQSATDGMDGFITLFGCRRRQDRKENSYGAGSHNWDQIRPYCTDIAMIGTGGTGIKHRSSKF